VTSLCIASGAPTTTALRRIEDLAEAGLIERMPDPADRRRILVRLTEAGRARMDAFLQRQAQRLGVRLD
jgi:DNA-binding MarR family transcriptional regulator